MRIFLIGETWYSTGPDNQRTRILTELGYFTDRDEANKVIEHHNLDVSELHRRWAEDQASDDEQVKSQWRAWEQQRALALGAGLSIPPEPLRRYHKGDRDTSFEAYLRHARRVGPVRVAELVEADPAS